MLRKSWRLGSADDLSVLSRPPPGCDRATDVEGGGRSCRRGEDVEREEEEDLFSPKRGDARERVIRSLLVRERGERATVARGGHEAGGERAQVVVEVQLRLVSLGPEESFRNLFGRSDRCAREPA